MGGIGFGLQYDMAVAERCDFWSGPIKYDGNNTIVFAPQEGSISVPNPTTDPSSWQSPLTGKGSTNYLHEAKTCNFHATGKCMRGSQCKFAHVVHESQPLPDSFQTQLGPMFYPDSIFDDTFGAAHSSEKLPGRQQRRRRRRQQQPEWHMQQQKEWQKQNEHQELCQQLNHSYGQQLAGCSIFPHSGVADMQLGTKVGQHITNLSPDAELAASLEESPNSEGSVMPMPTSEVPEPTGTRKHKAALRISKNVFHKTKLCKFFPMGLCHQGEMCPYAHAVKDLNPLPDLLFTKLCPDLIATGACMKQRCTFAHDEEELRQAKHQHDMKAQPVVGNDISEDPVSLTGDLQVHIASCVKNTFLHIPDSHPSSMRPRSKSTPM